MAILTVQIPDAEEVTYEFSEPQVTVGRNEGNSIVIQHTSMSGTHAQFVLNPDGSYTLSDNGSTNGTFVNGEQIVEAALPNGAEILFGQVGAHFSQPELTQASPEIGGAPAEPMTASASVPSSFQAGPLDSKGRPANFVSISRFPKTIKKKDPAGTAIMALGFIAMLVSVGLVGLSFVSL